MGITFVDTEKKFVFDFEHDGAEDIVSLTGNGYQVEAFGKCFYYGYEFSDQVESSVRSAFIKYVKFTEALQDTPDLTNFIKKAVDNLHKKINLYNFDLVVMPESSSKVNQYMLRYIYRFAQPTLYKMTLVKALPSNISWASGRLSSVPSLVSSSTHLRVHWPIITVRFIFSSSWVRMVANSTTTSSSVLSMRDCPRTIFSGARSIIIMPTTARIRRRWTDRP